MKTTIEWLDAARAKHGLSDYAIAGRLGLTRGQVSKYRTGRDFLSDDAALKIAELLEIDARVIVASAHAERAKSDDARKFWERLAGVAAGVVMATGLSVPSPAQAVQVDGCILCQLPKRRRDSALRRMADLLAQSFTPSFRTA